MSGASPTGSEDGALFEFTSFSLPVKRALQCGGHGAARRSPPKESPTRPSSGLPAHSPLSCTRLIVYSGRELSEAKRPNTSDVAFTVLVSCPDRHGFDGGATMVRQECHGGLVRTRHRKTGAPARFEILCYRSGCPAVDSEDVVAMILALSAFPARARHRPGSRHEGRDHRARELPASVHSGGRARAYGKARRSRTTTATGSGRRSDGG